MKKKKNIVKLEAFGGLLKGTYPNPPGRAATIRFPHFGYNLDFECDEDGVFRLRAITTHL